MRRSLVTLAVSTQLAAGVGVAEAGHRLSCDELNSAAIPETTMTLATQRPATTSPPAPEHCEVVGRIRERTSPVDGKAYAIGFRLRLPSDWNRRFLFQGGGGLDGFLGNALGPIGNGQADNALLRGYAVVATDSGHLAEPVPAVGGALFGVDPDARLDFGYRALEVVAKVAKEVIRLHYGRPARHSYFVGCSNGGRQGMVASQRFPDLFDGIVAVNPGFNLPRAAVGLAADTQAFAGAASAIADDGQPYLPTTFSFDDLALVATGVLQACDGLDGLSDGIIDGLTGCHFDPSILQCPGAKDATCLSPEQITALQKVAIGANSSTGGRIYAGKPYDAGMGAPGWRVWNIGFPSAPPLVNNSIAVRLNAPALAYVFVTPPDTPTAADVGRYTFEFDLDTDAPRIFANTPVYTQSSEEFMTAASTDLRRFRDRGGKLIVVHGGSDPVFSVSDTIAWYEGLLEHARGPGRSFARLFLVPGMNHCGGGPATDEFDQLAPIADWVEHGRAPARIVGTANAGSPWPGRTRPLCPYPKQARYRGMGDVDDAASFVCKAPRRDTRHSR